MDYFTLRRPEIRNVFEKNLVEWQNKRHFRALRPK